MSEAGDGTGIYRLYAVVVYVDMLNASYFGHYICYTKDFDGNWYRIDDCKVMSVELEEVLAQGAYMLLYSRTCARSHSVRPLKRPTEENQRAVEVAEAEQECIKKSVESFGFAESIDLVKTPTSNGYYISHPEDESGSRNVPVDRINQHDDCFNSNVRSPRDIPLDMDMGKSESQKCGSSQTVEITSCSSSCNESVPIELEYLETNFEAEYNFKGSNSEPNGCNIELTSSKCSVGCSSSGQNGVHHIAETYSAFTVTEFTSTRETLDENTRLENLEPNTYCNGPVSSEDTEVEVSKLVSNENTCSGTKRKPLFSRGFLDKSTRSRSLNRNGKAQIENCEVGPSHKVHSNCNGYAGNPDILHQNGSIEYNNRNGSGGNLITSCFVEEKSEKKVLGKDIVGNGGFNGESSHAADLTQSEIPISSPCEDKYSLTEAQNMEFEVSGSRFRMQCDLGN